MTYVFMTGDTFRTKRSEKLRQ